MLKMSPIATVFNLAGVVAALVISGYALNSLMSDTKVPPCTASYPTPTKLSLQSDEGEPLTVSDLQSRFGSDEWGLIDNVEVVRGAKRRDSEVLQVKLPAGTGSAYQQQAPKGGAGFSWLPSNMSGATGACLSYGVFLPKGFDYATGGMLPGLYGGERLAPGPQSDGKRGFATRLMWVDHGMAAIGAVAPANHNPRIMDTTKVKLAAGQWQQVTSEVVLNDPGRSNGILRLWLNGELALEHTDIAWRSNNDFAIAGVLADVSYGRATDATVAPADTSVQISPFELSWR